MGSVDGKWRRCSWRSDAEYTRCPCHGHLVVRRIGGRWLLRCLACLEEAARGATVKAW